MDETIFLIAVGLGMDAMSVAMAVGTRWHGPRQRFRLALHMGLFQALLPVAGWLLGRQLARLLKTVGVYIASVLVFGIGLKMLLEAIESHPGAAAEYTYEHAEFHHHHQKKADPTRGLSLIGLSFSVSIDAFVVGFSIGLKGQEIWQAGIVIGVVAALMALLGIAIGKRLGDRFGKTAEIFGALVLMVLGIVFLWL
jgi:putative Mn2+ efflux pump MntP